MGKKIKKISKKQVFLIAIVLLAVLGIIGYRYFKYIEDVAVIDVYYLNATKLGIEPVVKRYDNTLSNEEIIENVYKLFSEVPQSRKGTLISAKPENVEVLSYKLDDQGLLTVSFSPQYKDLTNIEEINLKAAFVWTFTDLDFVKKIKLEIDGLPYTTDSSEVIEYFDRTNVIVEPTIALDEAVQRDIVLYFATQSDADQKYYLTQETRTATTQEGVALEEVIVTELLKGSADGNKSVIPPDVRVRQVKRENSICFIDLDEKFLKGKLTEREQKLRVYSLVNSLTELNNVDKVQILINAKKTKGFDDIDISKPLKRNEYYIK